MRSMAIKCPRFNLYDEYRKYNGRLSECMWAIRRTISISNFELFNANKQKRFKKSKKRDKTTKQEHPAIFM